MNSLTFWRAVRSRHSLVVWALMIAVATSTSACNRSASHSNHTDDEHGSSVEEGDDHEAGVIKLDTTAIRLGGIIVANVDTHTTAGLSVTGIITYDENRVSHIGARTNGRVVALSADLGARVDRGKVLALLESPEVGQIRAEERQAEALVRIAKENYAREARLAEQGISSRKELLEAEAELRRSEASLRSAEERLRVLGAGHGRGGEFAVVAPFAGVVVARHVSLGEMAGPTDNLFTVADLSRVWIEFDVFERDFAKLKHGQAVTVTVAAYPGAVFPGRVVYVSDIVDTTKRTIHARVDLPNADGALKPGMFARGTIHIETGGNTMVVVPQNAVQQLGSRRVVFVPGETVGEFRAVTVEPGEMLDGKRIVILQGLTPTSRIVTAGAFILRAELQKDALADGGH